MKSRSDDGVPVGQHVVLVDNSDAQSTSSTGTWTKGDAADQHGYDHATHAAGTGTDSFTWTLNVCRDRGERAAESACGMKSSAFFRVC
jgi:hypothetical protein